MDAASEWQHQNCDREEDIRPPMEFEKSDVANDRAIDIDSTGRARKVALKKVRCPFQGCDWTEVLLGDALLQSVMTAAYQHIQKVHSVYTMHPRVEVAELPEVEPPEEGSPF